MERLLCVRLLAAVVALTLAACGGGDGGPAPPPPLTLTGVEPLEGSTAGGTLVTLHGSGFLGVADDIAAIRFGANDAPSFTVLNDRAIQCRTPPGRVGVVTVVIVSKEDGRVLRSTGFRYVSPLLWIAEGDDPDLARLYFVDLDAAQVGFVGTLGYALAGLAVSPSGVLFGVEDGNLNRLMQVDPDSGAATPTGSLEDQATGVKVDVRDVTFVGDRLIGRTSAGAIVEIDQTYGFVTVLQDLTPLVFGDGIAAAGPDLVHLSPFEEDHTLHEWDPVGLTTTAGPLVTTAIEGTVDALAFQDGMLYAVDADLTSTLPAVLLRIDPATGETTPVVELPVLARAVAAVR